MITLLLTTLWMICGLLTYIYQLGHARVALTYFHLISFTILGPLPFIVVLFHKTVTLFMKGLSAIEDFIKPTDLTKRGSLFVGIAIALLVTACSPSITGSNNYSRKGICGTITEIECTSFTVLLNCYNNQIASRTISIETTRPDTVIVDSKICIW